VKGSVGELDSKGVEPRISDRLLRFRSSPEAVVTAADRLAHTPAGKVGNPVGRLVRAVERGYGAPRGVNPQDPAPSATANRP